MTEEKKALTFEIKDNKLHIGVDPNKDGQPVLTVVLDIKEIPDEIIDNFFKKDGE